jgi:hypothetical protein
VEKQSNAYYKHLMGSSTQYFYDIIIAKRIEQGIKGGRISKPTEKKGFSRGKTDVDVSNVERGYIRVKRITKATRPHLPKYPILTLLSLFRKTSPPTH